MAVDPEYLRIEQEIEDCMARLHALQGRSCAAAGPMNHQGHLKRRLFDLCATLGRLDRHPRDEGQGPCN